MLSSKTPVTFGLCLDQNKQYVMFTVFAEIALEKNASTYSSGRARQPQMVFACQGRFGSCESKIFFSSQNVNCVRAPSMFKGAYSLLMYFAYLVFVKQNTSVGSTVPKFLPRITFLGYRALPKRIWMDFPLDYDGVARFLWKRAFVFFTQAIISRQLVIQVTRHFHECARDFKKKRKALNWFLSPRIFRK